MSIVNVSGERHYKDVEEVVTPAYTLGEYKPGLRGKLVPRWVTKLVPEKRKHVTVKKVEPVHRQFPAGEGECTPGSIGRAYEVACQMVEDGLLNVRLWTFDGQEVKVGKAEVRAANKARQVKLRLVQAAQKEETLAKAA